MQKPYFYALYCGLLTKRNLFHRILSITLKGDAMILVNIESLSLSELRSIAEQEGIENSGTLPREELISLLEEKYEEEDDQTAESDANMRYMAGLTDYRGVSIGDIPGVEELPESYPDTEIHLVKKNSSWMYAFWSISQTDSDRIQDAKGSLVLSVSIENDGKREDYDIPLSFTDSEWNVGTVYGDGWCRVALTEIRESGERVALAVSEPQRLTDAYWLRHADEMRYSDSLYRLYLMLLSTKEGELADNPAVREIIELFRKEDTLINE